MKLVWMSVLACSFLFTSGRVYAQASPASSIQLRYVTVLVKNQEEALRWYTDVLGLKKVEDVPFGPNRRWLVVASDAAASPGIVLELASDEAKAARIGKETNWVFKVKDCFAFAEHLQAKGVQFRSPAKRQPWGTVQAVFEDPYGNIFVAESNAQSGGAAAQ
jgi:catechol 2,3-dioxygenase-like lactoylglutathione lyase family enzyme